MCTDVDRFDFPELSDEAVMAVEYFLEEFFVAFQNHYFGQMHRYHQELAQRQHDDHEVLGLLAAVAVARDDRHRLPGKCRLLRSMSTLIEAEPVDFL